MRKEWENQYMLVWDGQTARNEINPKCKLCVGLSYPWKSRTIIESIANVMFNESQTVIICRIIKVLRYAPRRNRRINKRRRR